jgi:hypothetical protein
VALVNVCHVPLMFEFERVFPHHPSFPLLPIPSPLLSSPLPSPLLSSPLFFASPLPLERSRRQRRSRVRTPLRPREPKDVFVFFSFSSFVLLMSKIPRLFAREQCPRRGHSGRGPVVATTSPQRAMLTWPPHHCVVRPSPSSPSPWT